MDYMIFYRVLEQTHAVWGPQWAYKSNVIELSGPIKSPEGLLEVEDFLVDFHEDKTIEVISICPLG
jgi:hypothetical protein